MAPKLIQELRPDRKYPVFRVDRLNKPGRQHYILWVWETERFWGKYILLLHDFYCENEVIQVNNGTIYLKIIYRGLDPNGDPVVIVDKKKSNRPVGR